MPFTFQLLHVLCLPALIQAPPEPPLSADAFTQTEEAYRLQRAGDLQGALKATERALLLASGHPRLERLKLDLLLASGALDEAKVLISELLLKNPGDFPLRFQRVTLLQRMNRLEEAVQETGQLLEEPGIPSELARSARLSLADLQQAQGQPALALTTLAALEGDSGPELQARKGFLLLAMDQALEAKAAFTAALQSTSDTPQRCVLLQGLRDALRKAGLRAEQTRVLEELHAMDPSDRKLNLELAYAHLADKNDRAALRAFRAALGPDCPPEAWLDGAYTAKRLGNNQEAAEWFKRGLDARRALPEFKGDTELDFGLRREVETLQRTWGATMSSSFRQVDLFHNSISNGGRGDQKAIQQGLDLYWQPGVLSRDGRTIQVFLEAFENLWNNDGETTGGPTLQWALGARAKPFQQHNLVFGAQKLFKGGHQAQDDWMFRVSYSIDRGLDLRPGQDRWRFWSIFTEGASLARSGKYVQTCEARLGETFRFASTPNTVWSPHLVVAGDHDNRAESQNALGLGAGISIRNWFRENKYQAPASWIEISIQGRTKLTEAPRSEGLFVLATICF